jgi:Ca-activated chloride channel homolog
MAKRVLLLASLLAIASLTSAQVMSVPSSGFGNIGVSSMGTSAGPVGLGLISSEQMTNNLYGMLINMRNHDAGENASSTISRFDLKAPSRARREYDKGFQLLLRKEYQEAIAHLSKSIELYPSFVAAHNALGSAYLSLGQNDNARQEFTQAVTLDDHLPNSHLNLGIAQLALKNYSAAEDSLKKASSVAPLDLSLAKALAYGEFVNQDYPGVIATETLVHKRKHDGAAVVHYFAAGAWDAQHNVVQARYELETLLKEDPKFPAADEVRQLLQRYKAGTKQPAGNESAAPAPVNFTFSKPEEPSSDEAARHARQILQDVKEKNEIAEADAAEAKAESESTKTATGEPAAGTATRREAAPSFAGTVLHASVDEVAVFFAATDHGKSVTDLTGNDVGIRDNQQAPATILGFRNEGQLPLRMGLIIDVSDSVSKRFSFEQKAAINFLQKVMTGKEDQAFVVGVNNMVLLVQDFTSDQAEMAHAIGELVPSGGTALWDAVSFGAEKLAGAPDVTPVARVLVVISDGQNNSSIDSLKDAIAHAQRGEVAVYTVSTRDFDTAGPEASVGDHALRTLSEQTGGAAFVPGSIRRLNNGLSDLQEVLRGRYLVSYKPAGFQRNGQYRAIDIQAQKDGHKLKIYARKGYYASGRRAEASDQ